MKFIKLMAVYLPFFVFASCSVPKPGQQFPIPKANDINEIVKAIVEQDSLSTSDNPLLIDLQKITVFVPGSGALPPPLNFYSISIKNLIGKSKTKTYHFANKDSLYLFFQNDTIKHFKIDKAAITELKIVDSPELTKNGSRRYIDLSIPIFSLDQQKAYVQLNRYCPFCGSGLAIYLQKIKGKWVVADQMRTWIN